MDMQKAGFYEISERNESKEGVQFKERQTGEEEKMYDPHEESSSKGLVRKLSQISLECLAIHDTNPFVVIPLSPFRLSKPLVGCSEIDLSEIFFMAIVGSPRIAKFTLGIPGFVFLSDSANADYYEAIQSRVDRDKEDMKLCLERGSISALRSNVAAVEICYYLKNKNKDLFRDFERFKVKWEEFSLSSIGLSCKADWSGLSPIFNLNSKGYHNDDHANEMFADTVVKLHQDGMDESLCIAGGTMAYFHDMIQGLDHFPGTGKNENVTAKFLNFLIDEAINDLGIDDLMGEALKSLANATIVGGTLLIGLETQEGGKNQTPQMCVDYSDLIKKGRERDYRELSKIREVLTINDISRTEDLNYTFFLEKTNVDESTIAGQMIGSCYDAKALALAQRSSEIEDDISFKKIGLSSELFGRVCQSIRMLIEIQSNKLEVRFSEKAIIDHFRNGMPPGEGLLDSFVYLGALLRDPITWAGGFKNKKFVPGEAQFAMASGQHEYASMISSSEFKGRMAALNEDEMHNFIGCAVSGIQDGKYIRRFLEHSVYSTA